MKNRNEKSTNGNLGIGTWVADQVERRPIAALVPYARNARVHTAEQVDRIVASMKRWGVTMPILVDEAGEIIAGHGRVQAAQKLGYGGDAQVSPAARPQLRN